MSEARKQRAIIFSISAALLTMGLKFVAYLVTDSVGLLSDAMESVVNLVAAIGAYIALTIAARPADESHPYGHTKVEYFSSRLEAGLIAVAAIGIGWSAVDRLIHPRALEHVSLGLIISGIASLLNLAVARHLIKLGKQEDSIILEADGKHLMTDVITSAGVIVGVSLVWFTGALWLDPVIAIAVALNILYEGSGLVKRSVDGLVDRALPAEENARIASIIDRALENVEGASYHGLRIRRSGNLRFLEMHLLVPGAWPLQQAHDLSERVESALKAEIATLETSIHLEPSDDPRSYRDSWEARELT